MGRTASASPTLWIAAVAFSSVAAIALAAPETPPTKALGEPAPSGTRASMISRATPTMSSQRAAEVLARLHALVAGDSPTLAGPTTPRGIESLGGDSRRSRSQGDARNAAWADYDPTDKSLPTWSLRLKGTNQFAVKDAATGPAPRALAAPQLAPMPAPGSGAFGFQTPPSSSANPWSSTGGAGAAEAALNPGLTPAATPLLSRSATSDFETPTAAPVSLEGAAYGAAPTANSR
jgi:hypothetical protein